MNRIFSSSLLALVLVASMTACHSPASQSVTASASSPAYVTKTQVERVVNYQNIRNVLLTGNKQADIGSLYDTSGIFYLKAPCVAGTIKCPGRIGLSTGVTMQTSRYGKVVNGNSVRFPFNAAHAYLSPKGDFVDGDKTDFGGLDYVLIADTETHHRLLAINSDGSYTDMGYRLVMTSEDEGDRFTSTDRDNSPKSNPNPKYDVGTNPQQHYKLVRVYTGDNVETSWTQSFIDDVQTSAVTDFVMSVNTDDPFAKGALPTGPFRDSDKNAGDAGSDDSADTAATSDDSKSGDAHASAGVDPKGAR